MTSVTASDRERVAPPDAPQAPACLACAAPGAVPWRAATPSDLRFAARPRYDLVRCARCGTAAIAPGQRSLEGPLLYSEGSYRMQRMRFEPAIEALRRAIDRDRLRAIGRLPARSEVVEVGAGDGRLLASLACRGHRVAGFEPSAPFAERARARGLDVQAVRAEDASCPPSSCDAVVMWHVLEHLEDPGDALARARTWLRPGGRLVVAVPNLASWQARAGGDRWFHQDVPRHLTHFTPAGLSALLSRLGFRVTRVRHLLLEHNTLGMWQTLLNSATRERDVAFRSLKRTMPLGGPRDVADLALSVALGGALIPVAALVEGAAAALGRSGTIVVQAQ